MLHLITHNPLCVIRDESNHTILSPLEIKIQASVSVSSIPAILSLLVQIPQRKDLASRRVSSLMDQYHKRNN